MKLSEGSMYVRTLMWASDRGSVGFLPEELKAAVARDEEEWKWIQRMFLGGIGTETPLIFHSGQSEPTGGYRYYLTAVGAGALVDYQELKQAHESGKQARILSWIAIAIGIVVGLTQIYFQAYPTRPVSNQETRETLYKTQRNPLNISPQKASQQRYSNLDISI